MAPKTLPSRYLVRQLLRYDAETGEFTWLPRPREMFTRHNQFLNWNSRYPGQLAGSAYTSEYLAIGINGIKYLTHRLAWLCVYGEPVPTIDHIDGNRANNRIANLRAATRSQNMANSRGYSRLGVKGVVTNWRRFGAKIVINRKAIWLGTFDTIEEAAEAYRETAIRLRGEFARFD